MFLVKVFAFVFTLIVLFVVLLLIFGRYRKVSNKIDRWICTDTFFGRLDSFISVDRFILNRLAGTLIFTGSSCILIYFLFYFELTGLVADISKAFSVIFGLAGIFTGVGLMMGGKTIRKINDKLSFRVSTERLFRPLDKIVKTDDWFYKHYTLAGILVLFACILINLRLWLAF